VTDIKTDKEKDGQFSDSTLCASLRCADENGKSFNEEKFDITVSTYPERHWCDGFAVGTKMQMQDNNGDDNSEDTQADDE